MRKRKKQFLLLPTSFVFLALLIYLVLNFSPSYNFDVLSFKIPIVFIFLTFLFAFLYFFFSYIFLNTRRGLLIALFAIIFLLLRLNGLTQPFFTILLIILFASLELFFVKRK